MEVEITTLDQNSKKPPIETSTSAAVPQKGRKKRSAISKLTEKRRNNESGSEFGSTYSLQSNASRLTETKGTESELSKKESNSNSNNDVAKSQNANATSDKGTVIEKYPDSSVNKDNTKSTPKPRDKKSESVVKPEELSPPPPMDIDSESDDDKQDGISKKAPSDATIHRFRALKMATNERTNSVESLRNSPFAPKPPSTPRSEQKSSSSKTPTSTPESDKNVSLKGVKQKGEKRFRDPNSSGEEPEVGVKSKKQSCSQTDLKSTTDEVFVPDKKKNDKKVPSPRGDPNLTIDSEADLKDINNRYHDILSSDSLPRTGRLAPIVSKNHPPPISGDISSHTLKTAYKTDSSYTLNKYLESVPSSPGASGSPFHKPPVHPPFDTMSQRSMSSSGILYQIPITEARARTGSGNASVTSSLMGAAELDRYLPERRIKVWIGSWNMGDIKEFKASLQDFLLPEASDFVQDLYAIGTQENNMNKKEWEVIIQTTLGTSHVLFYSATHGSLHLAIFIRRDLIWFCSDADEDQVTTRAVTMVKTKGAVAVSFSFFGSSFLFINSHFASNRSNQTSTDSGKLKERINDYQKINTTLKLPRNATGSQSNLQGPASSKFDAVFWFGDLNFRLEKGRHTVEDLVHAIVEQEHPNFEDLLQGDELAQCIYQDKAFQGFTEGRINFKPTYKFDLNSDVYDTSPKFRIPSYTDRILYHSKKKNTVNCVHYDAVMNIRASDHRPVYGVYEAAIKPGKDSLQPASGKFDRDVFVAAQRRRAFITPSPASQPSQKSSGVCSIQ
ncbi:72 kDa inositol polyphosphate 5-phosphatase-like isoform X2 [Mizuhopecten yessoensis]|uniref:72 kDa inositol polyphosphate 5-phosphatase-like isoform X2 n=1 Tax=Mizuhopecten yessoensis TaxID=6573 RepID=UPI000B45E5C7|nr:72 kDa inositol polyphosphate 5-phosphatase-like isoform X2 [Mizuhopecten yessoensis]